MPRPEVGFCEEGEDAADDADDVGGAAVEDDPREPARRVGEQLQHRGRLPLVRGGGREDVVADEVGEDLAELGLEVDGGRGGGGGGGGGGGDDFSELLDVAGEVGHGRRSPDRKSVV